MALWLVRCGRHGEAESLALGDGLVGIGWDQLGDLGTARSPEEVRARLEDRYPDAKQPAYEELPAETQAEIPLLRVWTLVPDDAE